MQPERSTASTTRPLVLLSDLTDGLVWPRLLRAGALAFNPTRLGLAFFAVLLCYGIMSTGDALSRTDKQPGVFESCGASYADVIGIAFEHPERTPLVEAFYGIPTRLLADYPVTASVFGVLLLVVFGAFGVAISRSAAAEFSQGVTTTWPEALGFSLKRLASGVGSLIGPMVVIALIALLLSLAGMVFLSVPVLNVVGGIVYGLGLVLGFIAVLSMVALALGWALLLPAIACEATDAIDAIQRAYSYVFGRPLRLLLYGAILFVQGVVLLSVVALVAGATVDFTSAAAGAWTTTRGTAALSEQGFPADIDVESLDAQIEAAKAIRDDKAAPDTRRELARKHLGELRELRAVAAPGATYKATHEAIGFWMRLVGFLVGAFGLSYLFCASTLLYLAIRRVHDGQDESEVWFPGMIEGSLAPIQPLGPDRVPDADERNATPSDEG